MSAIIVISPDKLSQSMFCSYLEVALRKLGKGVSVKDLNMLYSPEIQNQMYSEYLSQLEENQLLVIKYKIKQNTDMEKFSLPPKIQEEAEYIVLFDIYSTHAEVLKDTEKFPGILNEWEDYVRRLS
jgi:hypothetical protein